jgi:probable rRNA maturation factor
MRLRLVDRRAREGWLPPAALWAALEAATAPAGRPDWCLAWVLLEDAAMSALNAGYRGAAEVTDVLSFSYLAAEGRDGPALAAGDGHAARDLWRDPVEEAAGGDVGEIVLAPAFVAERCRLRGWSFPDEVALLTVHGALHVLGWEHGDEDAAAAMRAREAALLRGAGLAHPMLEGGQRTDGE